MLMGCVNILGRDNNMNKKGREAEWTVDSRYIIDSYDHQANKLAQTLFIRQKWTSEDY